MPPKKAVPALPKKPAGPKSSPKGKSVKVVSKNTPTTSKPAGHEGKACPQQDKPSKVAWTKEDEAARKIQTGIRSYLARKTLRALRKKRQDYNDLMDKMERDACIQIAQQRQKEAEIEAQKEAEERKRIAEQRKRVKRMLEAAFDGDIDGINIILKEVRGNDDNMKVGHDVIGQALRTKHLLNMVDCEDAHGNTPLSEAASGGHADAIKLLASMGADPNSRGQFGRTPLYRAAFAGHVDCCQVLLQNGADPRLYASDGMTAANIASIDSVKELFQTWDNSMTDRLLEKIQAEKQRIEELEKQKREAEHSQIEKQISDARKEYDAQQKTLNSVYSELNKRIEEHDTAPSMGFSKPEITLQGIHDAELQLAVAQLNFDKAKEKLQALKVMLHEHGKQGSQETDEKSLKVRVQELPDILMRDVGNKVKNSGKWPMIIDETNRSSTFLRYQDTNFVNALMPKDMETSRLRMAIIGAIRYGKPLVLDMMEVDMVEAVDRRMSEITPNLFTMIMDKSILQDSNYLKLVKPEDGPEYKKENFNDLRLARFLFVILTKNLFPSNYLLNNTFPIRVAVPE